MRPLPLVLGGAALFAVALLCAACLLVPPEADAAAKTRPGLRPIAIRAQPIGGFQRLGFAQRFGEFAFRGGLALTSDARFGGLSGFDFRRNGSDFVAVSDVGYWFTGRLERRDGWLTGIADAKWGPMLNDKGAPLGRRRLSDAESLRLLRNGRGAYVSFEQSNDLKLYRFTDSPALARPEAVKLPSSMRGLVRNKGLETVALAPENGPLAGSPVLVAEGSLDKSGNHRAWVLRGPRAGAFSIRRSDGYDVTDGAFMPNGDLLILERRLTVLPVGFGMRLRRLPGDAIRPGALVDGPVALRASMVEQIDNMEALAVSTDADGGVRVTIVSDDNLNRFQRTLIVEFAWLGPPVTD